MYQNYYFLKLLLFLCLKYFTNDNKHYLELRNIGFTYLFLMVNINNKLKEFKINFSKYNDLLYYDKNDKYFENDKKSMEKFSFELNELKIAIEENRDIFIKELLEFLK